MARKKKPKSLTAAEWAAEPDAGRLFDAVGPAADRKHLLFATACCFHHRSNRRRRAHSKSLLRAYLAAEQFADGELTAAEIERHWNDWVTRPRHWAHHWAHRLSPTITYPPPEVMAALVRCVYGNPFRPAGFVPDWRTDTTVALAAGIYVDKGWDRLPVLADALDDAGCDDPEVIGHLRDPGPHVRGCWVVDEVLGRS